MAQWADYGISAVKYNSAGTHIVQVRVHANVNGNVGTAQTWERMEVVSAIEKGNTFVTLLRNSAGNWQLGEDVRIVVINGVKYIRTDNNNTPSDNLGSLPEF